MSHSRHKAIAALLITAVVFATAGAGCPHVVDQYALTTPPVLPPTASLEQVIQRVNENSFRIERLATTEATISSPGVPNLRASLAYERPRHLRLMAKTALTGPEIDLGSNDEVFWVWVQRSEPPTTYFCRHDLYASSQARQALPIEPDWLIEALGVTRFDPRDEHQGPYYLPDGRIEIRSLHRTQSGVTTKVVQVDSARGAVVQQHLYDEQGRLVAAAAAHEHHVDPLTQIVLPRQVEIEWPFAQVKLRIALGDVDVNGPLDGMTDLWTMPSYEGAQLVDLSDPRLQFTPVDPPSAPTSNGMTEEHPVLVRKPPLEWIQGIFRR